MRCFSTFYALTASRLAKSLSCFFLIRFSFATFFIWKKTWYESIEIVFCLNYFTANDQEKQVKCNLIFPQGAKVEKRTASKSFLKARPKAEPSECLWAGLFSTEAPWGKIKLHETGFSVSFQLKNNSNRMFFRIYWTFLKILK